MPNTTLRIFVFIETSFRSEDLNHALERRFFENPAILALEDDSHTSISAYAHVTGILFKITTVKHSESRVRKPSTPLSMVKFRIFQRKNEKGSNKN